MKLTIQTEDKSENHITLHLETNSIFIAVTEDADIVAGAWLSPFEAQTIANVLLQMASKLEVPEHTKEDKSLRLETIADTIYESDEFTITELIAEIGFNTLIQGKYHKYVRLENGKTVLIADDVWENEIAGLEADYKQASHSYMNIKKDADGNWWLKDTLPF